MNKFSFALYCTLHIIIIIVIFRTELVMVHEKRLLLSVDSMIPDNTGLLSDAAHSSATDNAAAAAAALDDDLMPFFLALSFFLCAH